MNEPWWKVCSLPLYVLSASDRTCSDLNPGPAGLVSPWISRTISTLYSGSWLLTMKATVPPGLTLSLSVYPVIARERVSRVLTTAGRVFALIWISGTRSRKSSTIHQDDPQEVARVRETR